MKALFVAAILLLATHSHAALLIIDVPVPELPECPEGEQYRYLNSGELVDFNAVTPNKIVHCSDGQEQKLQF